MDDERQWVMLVAGTWPPMRCGIAPYNAHLAAGLRNRGYHVDVVAGRAAGEDPGLHKTGWGMTAMIRFAWHCRSRPPGIVHIQHPTRATRTKPAVYLLPLLVRLFARQQRVVTTFHYLRPVDLRTAALRIFFLLPAICSHAIVVTTEWEAQYARRLLPGKPVEVAPAGITEVLGSPKTSRDETRRRLGVEDSLLCVYFGYLFPNKGIETLLRALAESDEGIALLVIGGTYEGQEAYGLSLRADAESLGVESRVHWAGSASTADLASLLAAGDCAVLPFDEGASLKRSSLITVMSAHLPVISTTGQELDGSMRDGESLLLIPPHDVTRLADAMAKLRNDTHLRDKLAANGKQILEKVEWPRIIDVHERLYRQIRGPATRNA